MTTYVIRDGVLRDKVTGRAMDVMPGVVRSPNIYSDLGEYRSPIDGALITSRSGQREDLKRSGSVLAEPRREPRGYRNPIFAKPRGLRLNEE